MIFLKYIIFLNIEICIYKILKTYKFFIVLWKCKYTKSIGCWTKNFNLAWSWNMMAVK